MATFYLKKQKDCIKQVIMTRIKTISDIVRRQESQMSSHVKPEDAGSLLCGMWKN
jgi:hypothetical protein